MFHLKALIVALVAFTFILDLDQTCQTDAILQKIIFFVEYVDCNVWKECQDQDIIIICPNDPTWQDRKWNET